MRRRQMTKRLEGEGRPKRGIRVRRGEREEKKREMEGTAERCEVEG